MSARGHAGDAASGDHHVKLLCQVLPPRTHATLKSVYAAILIAASPCSACPMMRAERIARVADRCPDLDRRAPACSAISKSAGGLRIGEKVRCQSGQIRAATRPRLRSSPNCAWDAPVTQPSLSKNCGLATAAERRRSENRALTLEPRAISSAMAKKPKPVTSVTAWTSASRAKFAPILFSSVVVAIISL